MPNFHQVPESNKGSHSNSFSKSPARHIDQSLYQKKKYIYSSNITEGGICNFNIFESCNDDDDEDDEFFFVVLLTSKRRLLLFPTGIIDRDPHHCKFLTHRKQDLNLQRT